MGRPIKMTEFKRFSLRLPTDLFKKIQHKAVDAEVSVNDWITDAVDGVTELSAAVCMRLPSERRYPWRMPPEVLEQVDFLAEELGLSKNTVVQSILRSAV